MPIPKELVSPCDYYETADAEIDLERSRADVLIIHSSTASAQEPVRDIIAGISPDQFDRLAFPRVSENIRENPIVMDWAQVLAGKHNFKEIHVAEPKPGNKHQKAARTLLKRTFPDMKIEFHQLDIDADRRAESLVIQCADPRFQASFEQIIADEGLVSFERMAVAGASLAFRDAKARKWLKATLTDNTPDVVHIMDHTDCAIAGGLSQYEYSEHREALVHAASLDETAGQIKNILGDGGPRVIQHIVGINGKLKVAELQREAGIN